MMNLIGDSDAAQEWLAKKKETFSASDIFGDLRERVVWVDETDATGDYTVNIDPYELRDQIYSSEYPIFLGHDAGSPIGRVVEAEVFTGSGGETFVVALLGMYSGRHLSFPQEMMTSLLNVKSPHELPMPPNDMFVEIAFDPREVDPTWVKDIISRVPIRTKEVNLSLNSLDTIQDLFCTSVLFAALAWNPYVNSLASEAGRDTYAGIRRWIEWTAGKVSELRNPVFQIESSHRGCQTLFFIRGGDRNLNEAAARDISAATAQACCIIDYYWENGRIKVLAFEYDRKARTWRPSYAKNSDGALITDDRKLIVIANMPQELSLGFKID